MYLKASDTERYFGEKIFAKELNVSINNWLSYCLTMLTVCAIDIFAFEITWRGYWLVMLHTGKALQRDPGSPALSICHRNTLQRNHIPVHWWNRDTNIWGIQSHRKSSYSDKIPDAQRNVAYYKDIIRTTAHNQSIYYPIKLFCQWENNCYMFCDMQQKYNGLR